MFEPPPASSFSVTEITRAIREALEMAFDDLVIEGELSNVRRYRSGHLYFTLKDADARLGGVMWRGLTEYLGFEPEDGMQVRVFGHLSVYEARGQYQIIARAMRPVGEGELRQKFERLKRQLADEGLFDASHKKPLPPFPERIGVVTSSDGAAFQDIRSVLFRRYPVVRIILCPVRVQGAFAAGEIVRAVEAFGALPASDPRRPDLLIVGRGGGSTEDLWAFNMEEVARAIHASSIPVVSAVGHEIDLTIADLVADVRAATPTEAAEIAVPDRQELVAFLEGAIAAMQGRLDAFIEERRIRVRTLTATHSFRRPVDRLRQAAQRVDELAARLDLAAERLLRQRRLQLGTLLRHLEALHPEAPLRRGYAFVERDGTPVARASSLHAGDTVGLRFVDGLREATIVQKDV